MSPTPTERRRHQRFAITGVAQYDISGLRGEAPISDISSGGVRLREDLALPVGCPIRLTIDWPAQGYPISVNILGKVVRSGGAGTAIAITSHEYRSRPTYATGVPRIPVIAAIIGPK